LAAVLFTSGGKAITPRLAVGERDSTAVEAGFYPNDIQNLVVSYNHPSQYLLCRFLTNQVTD
jgi:hypothetical protein